MSDFLDILTHGRRLQGAVKELSIEELEQVQEKHHQFYIPRFYIYICPGTK